MIRGINTSKKAYFTWLFVFLLLFGILTGVTLYFKDIIFEIIEIKFNPLYFELGAYVIAAFPMGVAVRHILPIGYFHIPTEKLTIFPTIKNMFMLIAVEVLITLDLVLVGVYFVLSLLIGIVIVPYFLISGIILMISKKI